MINLFLYDNVNRRVILNQHEILLIKEFAKLWDASRNECKEDPTGISRLRAYREFTYIYLMLDWKSSYFEYAEHDRHEAALADSELTEEEFNDADFRSACRKYIEIQDSSRILSLIRTAFRTLEKMRVQLDNIDLDERDNNLKPIFKAKDVLGDIAAIGRMTEELKALEISYKKELSKEGNKLRGDNEPGFGEM